MRHGCKSAKCVRYLTMCGYFDIFGLLGDMVLDIEVTASKKMMGFQIIKGYLGVDGGGSIAGVDCRRLCHIGADIWGVIFSDEIEIFIIVVVGSWSISWHDIILSLVSEVTLLSSGVMGKFSLVMDGTCSSGAVVTVFSCMVFMESWIEMVLYIYDGNKRAGFW